MEKKGWKILAIVFIVLFGLLLSMNIWGAILIAGDEEQTNICYYEICEDYKEAFLEGDLCSCYIYNDEIREYEVAKTTYMR